MRRCLIGETRNPERDKMRNLWRCNSEVGGETSDINPFIGDPSLNTNGSICEHLCNSKGP